MEYNFVYRGIALASSLSKLLEMSILLTYPNLYSTCDLQFDFENGFSVPRVVLKGLVNRYVRGNSPIYASLIDASKDFDTVDHYLQLITKL